MIRRRLVIAVIGDGDAPAGARRLAFEVGKEIAVRGAVLVCGGRGGVMEAAAHGAQSSGGHTLGVIPTYDHADANRYIEFVIATGIGEARNAIIVATAGAIVALEGGGGTLSEIGLALKLGRPVVALKAWGDLPGLHHASTPEAAVTLALKLARQNSRRRR